MGFLGGFWDLVGVGLGLLRWFCGFCGVGAWVWVGLYWNVYERRELGIKRGFFIQQQNQLGIKL